MDHKVFPPFLPAIQSYPSKGCTRRPSDSDTSSDSWSVGGNLTRLMTLCNNRREIQFNLSMGTTTFVNTINK